MLFVICAGFRSTRNSNKPTNSNETLLSGQCPVPFGAPSLIGVLKLLRDIHRNCLAGHSNSIIAMSFAREHSWNGLWYVLFCRFLLRDGHLKRNLSPRSSPRLNSPPHVHISHPAENHNNISHGHRNSSCEDPRQLLQCKQHDRLHSDYCKSAHSGEYVLPWHTWSTPGCSHSRRNAIASFRALRAPTRNRAIGMREKGGHGQKRN